MEIINASVQIRSNVINFNPLIPIAGGVAALMGVILVFRGSGGGAPKLSAATYVPEKGKWTLLSTDLKFKFKWPNNLS